MTGLNSFLISVDREGHIFHAYSEDFSGVYGLGRTIEEAKASILDGMRIHVRECRQQPFQQRKRS